MQAFFEQRLKTPLRRAALVALWAAIAVAHQTAYGQGPGAPVLPMLRTNPKTLKPGAWVKYSIYTPGTGQAILTRITALEREGKGQWLEIAITNRRRQTLVMRTLISGSLARPGGVLKAMIQPPGHQPLLLPARLAKRQIPTLSTKPAPGAKLVGTERIKVVAGTFKARRFRRRGPGGVTSDVWFSQEVPGWPMIKARSPKLVLELVAHGTSGRSQVRGKPGKLDEKLLKQLGLTR